LKTEEVFYKELLTFWNWSRPALLGTSDFKSYFCI